MCSLDGIVFGFFVSGLKVYSSFSVLILKLWITLDVSWVEKLSVIELVITMVLSVIIGGEVGLYRFGLVFGILFCRLSTFLLVKVLYSLSFLALIVISRLLLIGRMIRCG